MPVASEEADNAANQGPDMEFLVGPDVLLIMSSVEREGCRCSSKTIGTRKHGLHGNGRARAAFTARTWGIAGRRTARHGLLWDVMAPPCRPNRELTTTYLEVHESLLLNLRACREEILAPI
jgi:hypothetical protein